MAHVGQLSEETIHKDFTKTTTLLSVLYYKVVLEGGTFLLHLLFGYRFAADNKERPIVAMRVSPNTR